MKLNKKQKGSLAIICALAAGLGFGRPSMASDFTADVIYQVFTDRFFNGRTDNDDPPQSQGMFDGSHKNWKAYWGGDLAGITAKLDYIKNLGCTAVWISPVIDNVNKPINDDKNVMAAPYHGYHARDFMRIEEHFGDSSNSFADFDALTAAAHKKGLKIFVDMPFNHTSPYNHGEYGALFNSGQFRSDVENDRNKYFNHLPLVKDYTDRFQLQYHTIFYLGDLNQENTYIDTYLKQAALKLNAHGADGTRLDAAKHANWAWEQTLANTFYSRGDHLIMGEWWVSDTKDPLYRDGVKFANKSGISLFDFPLAMALREAFKSDGSFEKVAATIEKEDADFIDSNELLTFIDNHDVSRFLSLPTEKDSLPLALGLLFTTRGIPIVYYGTEQNLHDDTAGGEDPYDRPWMNSFDQSSANYKLIQDLAKLRASNPAFTAGQQKTIFSSADSYVFSRQAGDNRVVVAINKSKEKQSLAALSLDLGEGKFDDSLNGAINGVSLEVKAGQNLLELPPRSVTVWSKTSAGRSASYVSAVRPPAATAGASATVYGGGFGDSGTLTIGGEKATVSTWSDHAISFNVPARKSGVVNAEISGAGGAKCQATFNIVEKKLIPVRFSIASPSLAPGEELFISGDCSAMGLGKTTWADAAGPMIYSDDEQKHILCLPLPAGQKVQFKLVVLDKNGAVARTEGQSHTYAVPAEGTWQQNIIWQN